MEELTSILGIVVAAGVLLAKALTREKAARAARETGQANPGDEAWPQIPPVTPNRRPAQTDDEAAPEHETSVFGTVAQKVAAAREKKLRAEAAERMQEVLRSLAEMQPDMAQTQVVSVAPRPSAQAVSVVPRPTTVPQAVNAPRPATATAAPRRGNREVLPEAFDLRRAIVYAEILKPKFDE